MNFNNIAIVSIKESDYRIHFWYMNINDVINIMKIFNLNEKSGIVINFLSYMKMSDKTTYYRKNWGIIPNRAKEYYENNRERLRQQARNKYRSLSEEEKDIKKKIWKKQI